MAPIRTTHDYYAILHVSNSAPLDVIKKSYRSLALSLHPDKNQNDDKATAAFQLLGEAWQTLSDPTTRRDYDTIWPSLRDKASKDAENMQKQQEETARRDAAAETRRKRTARENMKKAREAEEQAREEETRRKRNTEQERASEEARRAAEKSRQRREEEERARNLKEYIQRAKEAEIRQAAMAKKRQAEAAHADRAKAEKEKADNLKADEERIRREQENLQREREAIQREREQIQKDREEAQRHADELEKERKKAAKATAKYLKEDEEKQASIRRLEAHRVTYERDLFDTKGTVSKLLLDLIILRDLDAEDERWKIEKSNKSKWKTLFSSRAKEEERREAHQKETERLQRDSSRRIKTAQLEREEAEALRRSEILDDVDKKLALEKAALEEHRNAEKKRQAMLAKGKSNKKAEGGRDSRAGGSSNPKSKKRSDGNAGWKRYDHEPIIEEDEGDSFETREKAFPSVFSSKRQARKARENATEAAAEQKGSDRPSPQGFFGNFTSAERRRRTWSPPPPTRTGGTHGSKSTGERAYPERDRSISPDQTRPARRASYTATPKKTASQYFKKTRFADTSPKKSASQYFSRTRTASPPPEVPPNRYQEHRQPRSRSRSRSRSRERGVRFDESPTPPKRPGSTPLRRSTFGGRAEKSSWSEYSSRRERPPSPGNISTSAQNGSPERTTTYQQYYPPPPGNERTQRFPSPPPPSRPTSTQPRPKPFGIRKEKKRSSTNDSDGYEPGRNQDAKYEIPKFSTQKSRDRDSNTCEHPTFESVGIYGPCNVCTYNMASEKCRTCDQYICRDCKAISNTSKPKTTNPQPRFSSSTKQRKDSGYYPIPPSFDDDYSYYRDDDYGNEYRNWNR
ncbi:hypothetical protein BGZ60DRAFT_436769 [Tricladium varicosporioides]|nr:hypothetical protein BGZ60DRAFT_436769 [Hymenoscyphus varicosporioides]